MTIDLDGIEARAKAATPGPWTAVPTLNGGTVVHLSDGESVYLDSAATGAFIATAREDVPALCARVRELEAGAVAIAAAFDLAATRADDGEAYGRREGILHLETVSRAEAKIWRIADAARLPEWVLLAEIARRQRHGRAAPDDAALAERLWRARAGGASELPEGTVLAHMPAEMRAAWLRVAAEARAALGESASMLTDSRARLAAAAPDAFRGTMVIEERDMPAAAEPYLCPNCQRPRDDGEEWCTEKHTKAVPR